MANTSTSERARTDQIAAEFFGKSLQIILDSRVPFIPLQDRLEQQHQQQFSNPSSSSSSSSSPFPSSSPSPSPSPSPSSLSSSGALLRGPNRWFNLELEAGRGDVLAEQLEPWRRIPSEPLVLDIFLQQPGGGGVSEPFSTSNTHTNSGSGAPSSSSQGIHGGGGAGGGVGVGGVSAGVNRNSEESGSATLLERWVVHYERWRRGSGDTSVTSDRVDSQGGIGRGGGGGGGSGGGLGGSSAGGPTAGPGSGGSGGGHGSSPTVEVPVVYKHTVIMLRSLYCLTRSLPAYRLFRLAKSSSNPRTFSLAYRISPHLTPMTEMDASSMSTWNLTPVSTPFGRLCLSVAYRQTTAVTALEVSPSILPRIISDYVGSPTTDPLRRFPAPQVGPTIPSSGPAGRAVHVVPLVSSGPTISTSIPSASLTRRNSWATNQSAHPLGLHSPTSPSAHHPSRSPSLSPSAPYSHPPPHPQPYPKSQPIPIQQQNPSSRSRSPPSPPHFQDHLQRGISASSHVRCSSAPVSIPKTRSTGGSTGGVGHPHWPRTAVGGFPPNPMLSRNVSIPSSSHVPESCPILTEPFSVEALRGTGAPLRPSFVVEAPPGSGRGFLAPRGALDNTSPDLPFASTQASASQLLQMAPFEGQLAAIARATPPISGREMSALALARLPSFSLSSDIKLPAPLSISPLADSALLMSPPHPFHNLHQAVGVGGPPSGGRLSMYRAPLLGYGGTMASEGGREDDDDFALPFAVDDEEVIRRTRGDAGAANWLVSPGGGGALIGESGGQSGLSSRQSQDAAVGALVRSLRSAPPLRQTSLAGSSSGPSLATSPRVASGFKGAQASSGGIGAGTELKTRSGINRGDRGIVGTTGADSTGGGPSSDGSVLLSRRTSAEALEELRTYSEMRQVLLRQRGEARGPAGTDR